MFNLTFLVMHMAETRQKLEIAVAQAASVAQTYNCQLSRLDFQQEDGLMSSLPLGLNRIRIERSLTTSALAVFVPFVTQELFMGGDAMYYGPQRFEQQHDPFGPQTIRSPNGLILGTPGSGNHSQPSVKLPMRSSPRMTISSSVIPRQKCDTKSRKCIACKRCSIHLE